MKHDFHFVLDKNLKNNIIDFAKNNDKKFSETVVYIFNIMKPLLEKHYLKDVNCKIRKYSVFGADVDLHVYLDESDYKYLKQVQSNLYCFSMAQVLRWMLSLFFNCVKKYGLEKFCGGLQRFGRLFLGIDDKNSKDDMFSVISGRHMFHSIHDFNYICHIFDNEYNLISTKFT